jgi:(2Fe-2S) ferredoxin
MCGFEQEADVAYYEKHIFVCINRRNNSRSCAGNGSDQMQEHAKKRSRQMDLANLDKIRINKSGCLGRCEHGPVAVVYPDGVWYAYRTREDLEEIIAEHIGNNRIVERLKIPAYKD